jgi:hypothetical protein
MSHQINYIGQTTNATAKELLQSDGTRFAIASESSYIIKGIAQAKDTISQVIKSWDFYMLIKSFPVVGIDTVSFVGYPIQNEYGDAVWTLTLSADDTNKAFGITVTGEVGKTIDWEIGFDYNRVVSDSNNTVTYPGELTGEDFL